MIIPGKAKRVLLFNEGDKSMGKLLGNKGAQLAQMSCLGLPVPPGFTITTQVCSEFFQHNDFPPGLKEEYLDALKHVEKKIGRKFGDLKNPLLVSVRSGAVASMPGMMDTVLNLGINDDILESLIQSSRNPRWAYDTYRRFIQMFSDVVMGVDGERFEHALTKLKEAKGVKNDVDLTADDMKELVRQFKELNPNLPTDPFVQLEMAIKAVFQSWYNPRAVRYRAYNGISANSGTAVNVQSMVFGNKNDNCGTGVGFTRNPANGENLFYGEYLLNAQGEDVVAGIRTPEDLVKMKQRWPHIYNELVQIRELLEKEYRDMQDIEFTIEDGKLFMLQTRNGKRTAKASVKIAVDMVKEGLLTEPEGLLQINAERMDFFLFPSIDPKSPKNVIAKGLPASPGTRTGMIVFCPDDAERTAAEGVAVILVRRDTTPEDIHGMKAAEGILTQLGGMTSHAAVVARGMGTTCVAGCGEIKVDVENEIMYYDHGQKTLKRGDIITLDGTAGEVILGTVKLAEAGSDDDFQTVLGWADKYRTLKVLTNADTPKDATNARRFGAQGIGLCRTEHMFFDPPERIDVMRRMVLADTIEKRQEQLDQLFVFQRDDMLGMFKAMDGLPVTIRLLDPPLHEFLPHDDHAMEHLGSLDEVKKRCQELQEVNPMLGFRGCRLTVIYPEITVMQVKAIMTAACEAAKSGAKPIVEIMIPVVALGSEIEHILPIVKATANEVLAAQGLSIPFKVGTMIELPRACSCADDIAKAGAEFFSFGSNDLTQTVFGFSRDDMGEFVPTYLTKGLLDVDPFVSIDKVGVGTFMKMALDKALPVNPNIEVGICGEHGGDPKSIQFFHSIGLDYVSCSPFRVPIARIASGQAAVKDSMKKK